MTTKTKTLTATAVFFLLAVLFYLPVSIPHKLVFPVASIFVASLWLTPWQICAALFFSALGDWFGTCGNFLAQMGSFAIGHVFYIWFFVKRYFTKVEHDGKLTARAKGYLAMLVVCLVGLLFVVFTRVVPAAPAGVVRIGVGIYAVIISTMLLTGMLQRSTLYALGAVLFVFSDFILAWNRFVEPIPHRDYLVLVSYFLAQWLLFVRSTPYRIASLRPFRF
ncbi:MAG: lysoplasmalogenase [Bacteroidales bacterium]|nr:lysoplasmalogenase [Bacteroidales bacterium]